MKHIPIIIFPPPPDAEVTFANLRDPRKSDDFANGVGRLLS